MKVTKIALRRSAQIKKYLYVHAEVEITLDKGESSDAAFTKANALLDEQLELAAQAQRSREALEALDAKEPPF